MFLTSPRVRLLTIAALAAVLFGLAAFLLPHSPAALRTTVEGYGWVAPLLFVALWTAVTPALFSGTILAAAAGLLFGPLVGTALGVAGATLGGLLAFVLARRLGADAFDELAGRRVKALQERVRGKPFRAILLLRLMPGMPATWLNYVAGLARIPWRSFAAANALGSAPRVLIYAGLAGSVTHPNTILTVLSVALFAALGLLGLVTALRQRRTLLDVPA